MIGHLAVIGVGLIGGSLARALRSAGRVDRITGCGRSTENLETALRLGVIDDYATDVAAAVREADVILLATPLATTEALLRGMRDAIRADAVITDAGSAKASVVAAARRVLSADQFSRFVPGHPIAGTEKSGVAASYAELFQQHLVILTPGADTAAGAVDLVERMWRAAGADIVRMDMDHHDEVLAATSHLPHMLAYALVDCLAGMQERVEIFRYAAGGFADFTRIASSSPEMWNDICCANREQLLHMMDRLDEHLKGIRQAIRQGDNQALLEIFTRAKQARDDFLLVRGTAAKSTE